eukprot:scaffold237086_cov27-Prasinocladus_malaysianus.AAC.1
MAHVQMKDTTAAAVDVLLRVRSLRAASWKRREGVEQVRLRASVPCAPHADRTRAVRVGPPGKLLPLPLQLSRAAVGPAVAPDVEAQVQAVEAGAALVGAAGDVLAGVGGRRDWLHVVAAHGGHMVVPGLQYGRQQWLARGDHTIIVREGRGRAAQA